MNNIQMPLAIVGAFVFFLIGASVGHMTINEMRDVARVCEKSNLETVVTTTVKDSQVHFAVTCSPAQ